MTDREVEFIALWEEYADEESDELIVNNNRLMDYLEEGGFFTAPASTKYHGAYEGGLYDHSKQVYLRLKELTEKLDLKWQRPESPFIIGMFHDLCKCDQYIPVYKNEYESDDNGNLVVRTEIEKYEYNTNTLLKGHGAKSVMILSLFFNLTEEEMLCIRYHMGAYEKEEWTEFDMAVRKFENCLYVHLADQLASKIDNV